MMKMEPPTIYVPEASIEPIERLLKAVARLDRGRLRAQQRDQRLAMLQAIRIGLEPGIVGQLGQVLSAVPFVGILLSIALLPLLAPVTVTLALFMFLIGLVVFGVASLAAAFAESAAQLIAARAFLAVGAAAMMPAPWMVADNATSSCSAM